MKRLYIVANWKSNKTVSEANDWIQKISGIKSEVLSIDDKEAIICPPFTLLPSLNLSIRNNQLPFELGGQDVSSFEEGAYTGEINAKQLKEFADYVIIGHSERRKNFGENDEMVNQKIEIAVKYELVPILCISDINQVQNSILRQNSGQEFKSDSIGFKVQSGNLKLIVAYEPLFAIGSGTPDTPENADKVSSNIKKEIGEVAVLYGGSVNQNNVKSFTQMPNIDGVLVGGASLDPTEFREIINNS